MNNASDAKKNILQRIKTGLLLSQADGVQHTRIKYDEVFVPLNEEPSVKFAKEFTDLGGKFIYCENETEASNNIKSLTDYFNWKSIFCNQSILIEQLNLAATSFPITEDMVEAQVIITNCQYLIARTGSIIVLAKHQSRKTTVFAPIHIVIAYAYQLKESLEEVINLPNIQSINSSMISIITGPSRTADIEKTLVVGVHGPKELYVLFIDNQNA